MVSLHVGDIVTVSCNNRRFNRKQALIVGVNQDTDCGGPYGVLFPYYYDNVFIYPDDPSTIFDFWPGDLRKNTRHDEQDISDEDLAELLRGVDMEIFDSEQGLSDQERCCKLFSEDNCISLNLLESPLMIGFSKCMHEGCENAVVGRIMVKHHNLVFECDVCADHLILHGSDNDDFPFTLRINSAVVAEEGAYA
jgi:hypothetical protein